MRMNWLNSAEHGTERWLNSAEQIRLNSGERYRFAVSAIFREEFLPGCPHAHELPLGDLSHGWPKPWMLDLPINCGGIPTDKLEEPDYGEMNQ